MDLAAMLARLAADGAELRRAAAAGLDRPVPPCPGWTVRDAVEHTAVVYAHKSTVVEGDLTGPPRPWPPDDLRSDDVLDFYDLQLHRLLEALRSRDPATRVWTWFEPDQTVGFWVRRMMQETVVHRADVESAAGRPAPVDPEVAVDGIDELIERMLCYHGDAYAAAPGTGQRVAVDAGSAGWTVTLGPQRATYEARVDGGTDATLRGPAGDLLLALWNRLPYSAVEATGDEAALAALRSALVATTQ